MPQLSLYIDTSRNLLVAGLNNPALVNPSTVPLFFGDALTLQVFLLQNNGPQGVGNNPYSIISTVGLSLQVYLDDGTINGTVYTEQIVFQTDPTNSFFYASFPLNTQALQTLIGTNTSATCYLKIGYFQGGLQTTVFSGSMTISVGLPAVNVQVPPGQTPLSQQVAAQTYVPINGNPGQPIYLKSPNGKIIALMAVDNADGTASFEANEIN